ncbi:MAG: hypothetical protein IH624_13900 [Phycisphaerae bacterium]|nr:hypothetical protein [Phycisphaerae bacterium]
MISTRTKMTAPTRRAVREPRSSDLKTISRRLLLSYIFTSIPFYMEINPSD